MEALFATLAALIAQAPITTEYISRLISWVLKHPLDGKISLALSWLVGIGSTMLTAYSDIGLLGSFPFFEWYWQGLFFGVIVSAVANGLFQLDMAKKFLELIKARKK